jgi:hypothetical protein
VWPGFVYYTHKLAFSLPLLLSVPLVFLSLLCVKPSERRCSLDGLITFHLTLKSPTKCVFSSAEEPVVCCESSMMMCVLQQV